MRRRASPSRRAEGGAGAPEGDEKKMTAKKFLREKIKVGERELSVEIGRVAKQAHGSVIVRYGDTMLLVAAVGAQTPREGIDFFPLTVEYREHNYAAGRIPGNYFRREGRPAKRRS